MIKSNLFVFNFAKSPVFQFLNGMIKSEQNRNIKTAVVEFQFLNGMIKSFYENYADMKPK